MYKQAATPAAKRLGAPAPQVPDPFPSTPTKFTVYISRNYLPFRHVIKSETISAFNQNPRELHSGNQS